jgi:hypothetical protein
MKGFLINEQPGQGEYHFTENRYRDQIGEGVFATRPDSTSAGEKQSETYKYEQHHSGRSEQRMLMGWLHKRSEEYQRDGCQECYNGNPAKKRPVIQSFSNCL